MMHLDVPAFLRGVPVAVEGRANARLRRLMPGDLDLLLRFRAAIVEAIGNPEILRLMPDERSFVEEALDRRNFTVGLFDADRMVAFNSQFWPADDDDLRSLHLYDYAHGKIAANAITYAGGIMVDPALRGAGLQKFLMEVRRVVAGHVGREHHLSTVSFGNHFSWRNIMELGGRVVALSEFVDPRFGPTRRMLMHAAPAPKPLAGDPVWVESTDIEAQRGLLARGMVGAAFRSSGTGFEIAYQPEAG